MKTTKMSRAVLSSMINAQDVMFGGILMEWMDETAGIAAKRFAGREVTTAGVEKVNFYRPIPLGAFLDVIGEVIKVGNTSLKVQITVIQDGEDGEASDVKVADALFTFVAVDENRRPVSIGKTLQSISG